MKADAEVLATKPHRKSTAEMEYAGPAFSSRTHDSVTLGRVPPERLCMVTLPPKNSAHTTCTVLSCGSKSTTCRCEKKMHRTRRGVVRRRGWRSVKGWEGGREKRSGGSLCDLAAHGTRGQVQASRKKKVSNLYIFSDLGVGGGARPVNIFGGTTTRGSREHQGSSDAASTRTLGAPLRLHKAAVEGNG